MTTLSRCLACFCLVGCGGGGAVQDGGADAQHGGVDASADAAVDGSADAGVDASADAGVDGSAGTGPDASFDAGPDASGDGGVPNRGSMTCPGTDFEVEGSEAVDLRTGLRWQRFADIGLTPCPESTRLPTAEELEGLLSTSSGSTCGLPPCAFPGENCGVFRSSDPSRAVDFLSAQLVRGRSAFTRVRCVR